MRTDIPSPELIPQLRALWREAFGDTDEFLDIFFTAAFSPERCRCIADGDRVVAALYIFDCEYEHCRIAYIYAVATAAEHRGRGLCRTLMSETHSQLKDLGYTGCILVPGSAELFELYRKMGYSVCSHIRTLEVTSDNAPTYIRAIDKNEYAALRRHYLPRGGVIQENENLEFLARQASFYAGADFVLAVQKRQDTLYSPEFLGNVDRASGIVRALGCSRGKFRIPGTQTPFAMYLPLREQSHAAPNYFGLAFD